MGWAGAWQALSGTPWVAARHCCSAAPLTADGDENPAPGLRMRACWALQRQAHLANAGGLLGEDKRGKHRRPLDRRADCGAGSEGTREDEQAGWLPAAAWRPGAAALWRRRAVQVADSAVACCWGAALPGPAPWLHFACSPPISPPAHPGPPARSTGSAAPGWQPRPPRPPPRHPPQTAPQHSAAPPPCAAAEGQRVGPSRQGWRRSEEGWVPPGGVQACARCGGTLPPSRNQLHPRPHLTSSGARAAVARAL